ncbi:hypothetical protein CES85_3399 (plasmid) [Ochrobactrum quorumnocens]|uniref:Uncharacterized protein n=1 Tax=Ochrobactrum quorumnocens TaxID=271865 RepID=A0A248UNZ0_9HYPH|nr:hypothetical protein [[Ochrobactrum] quorumnocens]ASV88445.1 hypothetical protein CES85_3399 [[Ochrobactrum] quorumnocens]
MNWLAKLLPWKTAKADQAATNQLYSQLFASVEEKSGVQLAPETLTSVVGFNAGGPVNLRFAPNKKIFLTSELAMYEQQRRSADGLFRYELMTQSHFEENTARTLLTAIGAMTLSTVLGDRHTIDVSAVMGASGPAVVKLKLYSRTRFSGLEYGVYQLLPNHKKQSSVQT